MKHWEKAKLQMATVLVSILLMSLVSYTKSMVTTVRSDNNTEAVGFNERRPLYLLGLIPYSGAWPIGETARYVYDIAIEHINQNPGILPGIELKVIWQDTKVSEFNINLVRKNTWARFPLTL